MQRKPDKFNRNFTKSPATPPNHKELATRMENKSKLNQVITYNIHPQER
jgi:hypothetical protein